MAYNTLDDHVELNAVDENGDRVPIDLSIADATVKEKRGEVYVNLGKALSPTLRVDGGVNYEFSNLKVRGDATADRTLKFLKPNITLDWKPGGGWHAQLSVKRTVAQLDFYDFISVGDLSTKRINGGNADLEPQRTWEFRATVDHALFGDGLFKLDLGHDLVSKLQDRILICDEIDHPAIRFLLRRARQSRHGQALFRQPDARRPARHAVERPPRQVHRHHPAHPGRGPDQWPASATGAASSPTGSGI